MLSFKNRLRKENDFQRVFSDGKTLYSEFFFIKFRENESDCSRVGFIVSKKISKKAVLRNRIKRVLREAIRKYINQTLVGYDIVVIAQKKIIEANSRELFSSMEVLLKKGEIIR